MGLSYSGRAFEGADAPPARGRRAVWVRWRNRWGRAVLVGSAAACTLVGLGIVGMTVSTAVPLWIDLTGPFVFMLLPGDVIASFLPGVPPPYSTYVGLFLSVLLWTIILARLLRPRLVQAHAGPGAPAERSR